MCFGAEGLTTKIPWYHWNGQQRHCWWERRSLGTGNFQAEETFHVRVRTCFNSAKSFQQGPGVRHTRNQQGGKTGQSSHTHLALPVCKIPVDQVCFVSYRDGSGGSTLAEQAQAGYVVMIADQALLEGMAAPVTLVSWRSQSCQTCCSQCLCSGGHGFV